MAARAVKIKFYVYRIYDGFETVYVGKGSGKRLSDQKRSFCLPGEIVENCKSDDHAFKREKHWISLLQPTENKNAGGLGGRVKPRKKARISKEIAEIEAVGIRRYVAKVLSNKIGESNCTQFELSKVDVNRLHEVANGPRC